MSLENGNFAKNGQDESSGGWEDLANLGDFKGEATSSGDEAVNSREEAGGGTSLGSLADAYRDWTEDADGGFSNTLADAYRDDETGDFGGSENPNDPEKLAKRLRDEVLDALDTRDSQTAKYYHNASDWVERSGVLGGKAIADDLTGLCTFKHTNDTRRTEALLNYIDARFTTDSEVNASPLNDQALDEARSEYLGLTSQREDGVFETFDNIGNVVASSDTDLLAGLPANLRDYATSQSNLDHTVAVAYVQYLENPTKRLREALAQAQADESYQNELGLRKTLSVLEDSPNAFLRELPEEAKSYTHDQNLWGEDFHGAVMKYIQFKMDQAGVKEAVPEEVVVEELSVDGVAESGEPVGPASENPEPLAGSSKPETTNQASEEKKLPDSLADLFR